MSTSAHGASTSAKATADKSADKAHMDHDVADDQYGPTPPGAGFEHTDAHIKPIVYFIGGLAVSAAIIHFGLALLFNVFVDQRTETTPRRYPLADAGDERKLPPAPRLQRFPREDILSFRTSEVATLNSYSWVNRREGRVRIPINDAMMLTLKRGLPVRQDPVKLESARQIPADASAGRSTEQRIQ